MGIVSLILTIVGFTGICVCIGLSMADVKPFGLWITLLIISALVAITGVVLGASLQEQPKETTIQVEQVENHNQYSYCPYCGEEIR